jgi:hypothetical protein
MGCDEVSSVFWFESFGLDWQLQINTRTTQVKVEAWNDFRLFLDIIFGDMFFIWEVAHFLQRHFAVSQKKDWLNGVH